MWFCLRRDPTAIYTRSSAAERPLSDGALTEALLCIPADVSSAYPDSAPRLVTPLPVLDVFILARAGDTRWIPMEAVHLTIVNR